MDQPGQALAGLVERYPLPPDLAPAEVFTETAVLHGVPIHLAGVAIDCDGECVVGSAASLHEVPLFRAYMELVERLAVLAAIRSTEAPIALLDHDARRVGLEPREVIFPQSPDPARVRWARSNGVAAGADFRDAARRARWELVERDRVLRSWYGELDPVRVELPEGCVPAQLREAYELSAYAFCRGDGGDGDDVSVAGVFGFPRGGGPFTCGFGARGTQTEALLAAAAECLQRLAFLWGEELPTAPPAAAPTPGFHQEHYLYPGHHGRIRDWLGGEHARYRGLLVPRCAASRVRYVDLTPARLAGRLFVVKALPASHVPLAFGLGHPQLCGPVPVEIAVHPIA